MQKKPRELLTKSSKEKAEVLYRNLDGSWYAFTKIGSEHYYGKVPKVEQPQAVKLPPIPKRAK